MSSNIKLTQSGQSAPYRDSLYVGTIESENEEEAKAALARMRGRKQIYEKQDAKDWAAPYFRKFEQISPGRWEFTIVEEYTG